MGGGHLSIHVSPAARAGTWGQGEVAKSGGCSQHQGERVRHCPEQQAMQSLTHLLGPQLLGALQRGSPSSRPMEELRPYPGPALAGRGGVQVRMRGLAGRPSALPHQPVGAGLWPAPGAPRPRLASDPSVPAVLPHTAAAATAAACAAREWERPPTRGLQLPPWASPACTHGSPGAERSGLTGALPPPLDPPPHMPASIWLSCPPTRLSSRLRRRMMAATLVAGAAPLAPPAGCAGPSSTPGSAGGRGTGGLAPAVHGKSRYSG